MKLAIQEMLESEKRHKVLIIHAQKLTLHDIISELRTIGVEPRKCRKRISSIH